LKLILGLMVFIELLFLLTNCLFVSTKTVSAAKPTFTHVSSLLALHCTTIVFCCVAFLNVIGKGVL
jgi:hypothetical protein